MLTSFYRSAVRDKLNSFKKNEGLQKYLKKSGTVVCNELDFIAAKKDLTTKKYNLVESKGYSTKICYVEIHIYINTDDIKNENPIQHLFYLQDWKPLH
jgi:hypothetical protein